MGWLVGWFVWIWAAIEGLAAVVAATIAEIAVACAAAVEAAAAWVAASIAAIVESVVAAFTEFCIGLDVYLEGIWVLADFEGTAVWVQVGAYVGSIYSTFSAVLGSVYFKALMAVHQVAYLVSQDYRKMLENVFREISNVSDALGFWPQFMNLVLRDSRMLVLNASASLGVRYDMGEVLWLQELSKFAHWFTDRAQLYENNPAQLMADIDLLIAKNYIDNKGAFEGMIITGIDTLLSTTKTVVDDLVRIRTDMGKLVADLPEHIRKEVKPWLDDALKGWDTWVKTTWKPVTDAMDRVIKTLSIEQGTAKAAADKLVGRLKRPGQYLKEITYLSPAEEADDIAVLKELAYGDWRDEIGDFEVTLVDKLEDLEEIKETNLEPIDVRTYGPSTTLKPQDPGKPALPSLPGWFVGDY